MSAGRPSEYDPSFCQLVEEMGAKGYSVVEMAAEIGVSRPTLEENWTAKHPAFLEAFTHAKVLSQAWWERIGRENLIMPSGVNFQASVWSRSMAARFPKDWRENSKVENTHSGADGGAIPVALTVSYVDPPSQ